MNSSSQLCCSIILQVNKCQVSTYLSKALGEMAEPPWGVPLGWGSYVAGEVDACTQLCASTYNISHITAQHITDVFLTLNLYSNLHVGARPCGRPRHSRTGNEVCEASTRKELGVSRRRDQETRWVSEWGSLHGGTVHIPLMFDWQYHTMLNHRVSFCSCRAVPSVLAAPIEAPRGPCR